MYREIHAARSAPKVVVQATSRSIPGVVREARRWFEPSHWQYVVRKMNVCVIYAMSECKGVEHSPKNNNKNISAENE
jgi:hypothetical protein